MEALPLSLLAFAAGVYLLIKVKKEYLSSLFSVLAWFVIAASLVSIGFAAVECYEECEEMWEDEHECRMEKKIIIKDGGDGFMMDGCTMEGDSCVLNKEACEKWMGREGCDSFCKVRGKCIMSKDECMKMVHHGGESMKCGEGGMMKNKKGCCMHDEDDEDKETEKDDE